MTKPDVGNQLGHAAWLEHAPERTRYREEWFSGHRSGNPVRVFVIDGDPARSGLLVAQVHAIGSFATRIASSADAALSVANSFLPNIVLLNTDLPDLASYRLATALRWHSGLVGVRLIALTTDIPAVDRRRALEAGFERYLTIPVQQDTLESALKPSSQQGNRPKHNALGRRRH
jgi:DNA-binding response OmpR family regulator